MTWCEAVTDLRGNPSFSCSNLVFMAGRMLGVNW